MAPPPLTAEELRAHPEYDHTIWPLKPSQSGTLPVATGRGGPINIAYEVHGHGDRRMVVSTYYPQSIFGPHLKHDLLCPLVSEWVSGPPLFVILYFVHRL